MMETPECTCGRTGVQ